MSCISQKKKKKWSSSYNPERIRVIFSHKYKINMGDKVDGRLTWLTPPRQMLTTITKHPKKSTHLPS